MIVIINGAPCAGKTFLLSKLHKVNHRTFTPIRKLTTRERRSFETEENPIDLRYGCTKEEIEACTYTYWYNHAMYGIKKKELERELEKGNVPVIIIRDFQLIERIKQEFDDVRVLFVVGATGCDLQTRLKKQGRNDDSILERQREITEEFSKYIRLVDHCIINYFYDEGLYLHQFKELTT